MRVRNAFYKYGLRLRVGIGVRNASLECDLGFWVRNAGEDYGLRMRFKCWLGFRVINSGWK